MALRVRDEPTLSGLDVFNEVGALVDTEDKGTHDIESVGEI